MSNNQAQLGKLITYQKGCAFKSNLFQDEGVSVVKVGNLGEKSIRLDGCVKISQDKAQKYQDYALNEDDIIVTSVGSRPPLYSSMVGRAIKVQKDAGGSLVNQNAIRIRAKNDVNQNYIYQTLQTYDYLKHIMRIITGNANQVSISLKDLFKYSFYLPSIEEQKRIAQILSTWDKTIETIEKLVKNKISLKKTLLFSLVTGKKRLSSFENSEWISTSLGRLGEIYSGGTPSTSKKEYWNGDVAWCTPTDITALKGRKNIFKTNRSITQKGLSKSSANLLPEKSIIVCTRATIGDVAMNSIPMATNQGFKSIVPNNETHNEYIYYLVLTLKQHFIRYSSGSTFLELSKKDFSKTPALVPKSIEEQKKITEIMLNVDEDIELLKRKINLLKKQKKGLMQRLLTGIVRVN
jgi:type I restriction enzyme, S subunit